MLNIYNNFCVLLFTSASYLVSNAQSLPVNDFNNERYVTINNLETLFDETDNKNQLELRSLLLKNINDTESSKPIFIAVNEIQGVIKFGIKSNSEGFKNQRYCYLILEKENYKEIFVRVLEKMNVKYIEHQGNILELNEFVNLIL
jgi:hypothetical protein